MSHVGPWVSVRAIMTLRDQSKFPDHVTPRVRNCIDGLAEAEMKHAANQLLLGMLVGGR